MASALPAYLGFLLVLTLPGDTSTDSPMGAGVTGYLTGNRYFINTEVLPCPPKTLKYVFVLVKHAMAVPEYKIKPSYPNDMNHEQHWTRGTVTQRGRSLMVMIGRSLRTRYQDFLQQTSWADIDVSSINKADIKSLTGELGFRLLKHTSHKEKLITDLSWIQTNKNYDKIQQLLPFTEKCKWMKSLHDKFKIDNHGHPRHLTRCTESLYELLRGHINVVDLSYQEWEIDSAEKVYKLWTLLIFQILEEKKEPSWATENWTWIQSCVFENYRHLLTYHPAIPAMISGRLVHQMESEVNNGKKFHVHVTDDIAVLNMNWTLPNSGLSHWPEPGDALLYEFYNDNTVEVSSFSGWQKNFDTYFKSTTEEFFNEYKKRNIYLEEEQWKLLCNYDESSKPETLDELLLADPVKAESNDKFSDYLMLYGYKPKG